MDNSGFEFRSLTTDRSEKDAASALLAETFSDSPLFRFAFPQPDVRRPALRALFDAIVDDAARFGRVDAIFADEIVGVLLWYPPGEYPMSPFRALEGLPSYWKIFARSPAGLFRLYRAQAALDRLRPRQPHCHGYFLGGRAGRRTGLLLSRRMLDEADANHWPVYLETQDQRAVSLYLRLGFRIMRSDVEIAPGAPATWTMWRDPRSAPRDREEAPCATPPNDAR